MGVVEYGFLLALLVILGMLTLVGVRGREAVGDRNISLAFYFAIAVLLYLSVYGGMIKLEANHVVAIVLGILGFIGGRISKASTPAPSTGQPADQLKAL